MLIILENNNILIQTLFFKINDSRGNVVRDKKGTWEIKKTKILVNKL